jgi:spore germination protein YaaH
MPDRQIFYDPERKRWKRLRRFLDAGAVLCTLVVAGFMFNLLRIQHLPELLLPVPKHNYRALPDRSLFSRNAKISRAPHRKTTRRPSEIPFNTGEGLRAAYYVPYDEASYSSFKQHVHQIDMLFPEWLHVYAPQPTLLGINNDTHRAYPIVDGSVVHDPDDLDRIKHAIQQAKEDTEVFPHLNNFNAGQQTWDASVGTMLADPGKRRSLRLQILHFFKAYPGYHGLSLDFESLPEDATSAYLSFIQELYAAMHPLNLRLYVNLSVATPDAELKQIAANSDGVILMNYDEHQATSDPGPIASQEWFLGNLARVLKSVPKDKLICALGNYGYNWTLSIPPKPKPDRKPLKPEVLDTQDLSVSAVWQNASDADADLDLDYDTLNPHFEYIDEDANQRHVVWFLDGVTVLDEMRGARQLGLQTFALWRLGTEDSSLWNVWDRPTNPETLQALGSVQPGHDVDVEGEGDIMRVIGLPQSGKRTVEVDTDEPDTRKKLIVDEHMDVYPRNYTVEYYGYHPNKVSLSFDDGPDPKWTPKILDVLKQ